MHTVALRTEATMLDAEPPASFGRTSKVFEDIYVGYTILHMCTFRTYICVPYKGHVM